MFAEREALQSSKERMKQQFKQKMRPVNHYAGGARHRCAVCGRTELDDPNLEFRYCSRCNGDYEYCQDHLFTHTHVVNFICICMPVKKIIVCLKGKQDKKPK